MAAEAAQPGATSGDGGLVGVWGAPEAAALCLAGLRALQHRGAAAAGLAVAQGGALRAARALGPIGAALEDGAHAGPPAEASIGRVSRSAPLEGPSAVQPLVVRDREGPLAIAQLGGLTNAARLRSHLEAKGSLFATDSDAELTLHLMATSGQSTFANRLVDALYRLEGASCALLLAADKLVVMRDPMGFRPMVIGRRGPGWVVATETCATDAMGAEAVREVLPGEVIIIDRAGARSMRPWPEAPPRACVVEQLRAARADSTVFGQGVYSLRRALGLRLAQEHPAEADVVVPVPDRGWAAAVGFATGAGIPMEPGLIAVRSAPGPSSGPGRRPATRDGGGFAVVRGAVEGRRVVLVDDLLGEGGTVRRAVRLLRDAGARAVHVRIAAPPTRAACAYGVDRPARAALLAEQHGIEGQRLSLGADSLGYLSAEGLVGADGPTAAGRCDACFSGRYPIDPTPEQERVQMHLFPSLSGARPGEGATGPRR